MCDSISDGDAGYGIDDSDDSGEHDFTSIRVSGMVTMQRQRSETARLAINTFLKIGFLSIAWICTVH